jgi:hypothetical protein
MSSRKRSVALRRLGTVFAVVVLAVVGGATAAYADDRVVDTDPVKVEANGFDLGDGEFDNLTLSESATVQWLMDENEVTPVVTGRLALFAVHGECARVRVDYYRAAGDFLATRYGGTVCAPDNGINIWSFDRRSYTNSEIGKIKVSLEHQLANDQWVIIGSSWSWLNIASDSNVRITHTDGFGTWGIGFGGIGWAQGFPLAGGTMVWEFSGGEITPHLTGYLHAESAAGACLRMTLWYFIDDGWDAGNDSDLVGIDHGGTVCAPTNDHKVWSVDRHHFSHTDIRYVHIRIESLNDNVWSLVDSVNSYLGTYYGP